MIHLAVSKGKYYISVESLVGILNKEGIPITKRTLTYYRQLGLIDSHIRFKGSKKRYYVQHKVTEEIVTIKLLSSVCNLTLNEIAKLKRKYKDFTILRKHLTETYKGIEKILSKDGGNEVRIFSSQFLLIIQNIIKSVMDSGEEKKAAKGKRVVPKALPKLTLDGFLNSPAGKPLKKDMEKITAAEKESLETGKPVFIKLQTLFS